MFYYLFVLLLIKTGSIRPRIGMDALMLRSIFTAKAVPV